MKLKYGTKNSSKLSSMIRLTHETPFEIEGIPSHLEDAEEYGQHILENARSKAKHYFKQLGVPVFSCDSGLYFDEVTDEEQPGVLIRRVGGKRLTDDEMIQYYGRLAKKYGGKLTARYRNAICLVVNDEISYEYDGLDIGSEPFYIVPEAHDTKLDGFPLDSLSIEIESGEYYYDLKGPRSVDSEMNKGFIEFFRRVFKRPIATIKFKGFDPIKVELYPEHAPETTKNFIDLVNKGYYNDKALCRSVPNRLIQSGDPSLDPKAWTDDSPGYILDGEFNREGYKNDLSFIKGTLGMAMAAYEVTPYATAGSFFIMTKDEKKLDDIVPAFGRVIEGYDEVIKLNDLPTHTEYGYDAPVEVVPIVSIDVDTFGYLYDEPKKISEDVIKIQAD